MKTTELIPVTVDGALRHVPPGTTLQRLLNDLGHAPNDVGSAVNGRFVARASRDRHLLRDGDAVLLFQPIVGG